MRQIRSCGGSFSLQRDHKFNDEVAVLVLQHAHVTEGDPSDAPSQ